MNFEILKEISEYFYIDFKDILNGIENKSENIYNSFRVATEELLVQINKSHNFVLSGERFYNRIINNYQFQNHMINTYNCDSKLMNCLNKIQKKGNDVIHNKLKVFDEKDVKETFLRILILAKKVLNYERNIHSFEFNVNQVNKEFEKLINMGKNEASVNNKELFVNSIIEIDEKLNLKFLDIYINDEAKTQVIDEFKNLLSMTLNYIISFNTKYASLEDLKIGEYSDLYKAYNNIDIIKNYDEINNVVASLCDYAYILRDVLFSQFNIDVLEWIFSKTKSILDNDEQCDNYLQIAKAIDEEDEDSKENLNVNNGVYYVKSQKQFIVDESIYYVINIKKAINDKSKGNVVYSKYKLPDNYALDISLISKNIDLLSNKTDIFIVKKYQVAIRPCEIKKLIYAILGVEINISKTSKFYKTLMTYLQINKCTLYDILTANDNIYNDFFRIFDGIMANDFNYFKEAMNKAREIISRDQFDSGSNLLRFFTNKLENTILKDQLYYNPSKSNNEAFKNLYFHQGAYRFDRNPFSFSLRKHNVNISDLYNCISIEDYSEDMFVRKLINNMIEEETLFIDLNKYDENSVDKIKNYNNYIDKNHDSKGKLEFVENYVYKKEFVETMNDILDRTINMSNIELDNSYNKLYNEFLKNNELDSNSKREIIMNAFKNSSIAVIMGEAGSGKTELLCNYFTNIFKGKKILYISNTHTCLNNMKRRVKEKNELLDSYDFEIARKIYITSKYYIKDYDVVIIDECKSISNAYIAEILKKVNSKYYIMSGDIGQIDAIDLGNWFDVMAKMINPNSVFILNDNYRTDSNRLKEVWKKVRNKDTDVLNYLKDNKYIEIMNQNIFEPLSDDEIILCLNYSGIYGITSINSYFQNQNKHKAIKNNLDCYKIGDPIVFNENANNKKLYSEYIYNNLKGKIRNITEEEGYLSFEIKVDTYIPLAQQDVLYSNEEENWSIIKVKFRRYVDNPEDDNEEEYQSPFEVTYALSIHKAQGLEYDSVKIVIAPEIEDKINNQVFYTAITRAKKNLKIYFTAINQIEKLNILEKHDDKKDVELLKKLRD